LEKIEIIDKQLEAKLKKINRDNRDDPTKPLTDWRNLSWLSFQQYNPNNTNIRLSDLKNNKVSQIN
jgi:hypothetical protein